MNAQRHSRRVIQTTVVRVFREDFTDLALVNQVVPGSAWKRPSLMRRGDRDTYGEMLDLFVFDVAEAVCV